MLNMIPDPVKHVEDVAKETHDFMHKQTRGVFQRYPILFSFLIIFGVIAVMYGFESVIEYIPFFHDHPARVFLIGFVILVFTGSLYKKLDSNLH